MADRGEVPSSPLVTITVDDRGRLRINGHDVPHDSTVDLRRMATDIVSSDFARPLGRPVRALATLPHEQLRMVIHPDGRVTDVEPHRPITPAGVPPATRAQGWLATRDAHRVEAEVAAARHAGQRRRYPLLVGGAGAIAAAAALMVAFDRLAPVDDREPTSAKPSTEVAVADVPPVQPLVESEQIRPFAVSDVSVEAAPGVLNLTVAARRRTPASVVVTPLEGSSGAQRLTLTIRGAADRVVTVPDLAPGRYRWTVVVPGQPRQSGVVEVPEAPPPVEVVTVSVVEEPSEPAGSGDGSRSPTNDGGDDARQPIGVSSGPNHPVDPDGD